MWYCSGCGKERHGSLCKCGTREAERVPPLDGWVEMGQLKNEGQEILRVLCGSRAYGLDIETSDYDYHGIYVIPTAQVLGIGAKIKETSWLEGEAEDNTAWEIGHFLHLATQCNPTILETFVAPVVKSSAWGDTVRKLFPWVLSRQRVFDAFTGYAHNQRKKMLDRDGVTNWKFAVAYLRVLTHGIELLGQGRYNPRIAEPENSFLRDVKAGKYTLGDVIDEAEVRIEVMRHALNKGCAIPEAPDMERVNKTLLDIRKAYWE